MKNNSKSEKAESSSYVIVENMSPDLADKIWRKAAEKTFQNKKRTDRQKAKAIAQARQIVVR